MIRIERGPEGRIRVSGWLDGHVLELLWTAIGTEVIELDLSGVERADDEAVRTLAKTSPESCRLVGCPTWLALWIERARAHADGSAGCANGAREATGSKV